MGDVTRQEYIRDLAEVQRLVTEMGEWSLAAVKKAMQALFTGDREMARRVMREDDAIDDRIIDIEDKCILLIAKQQPIARDLRVIATGFKISTDMERIGDHAFDIAKTALDFDPKEAAERIDWIRKLSDCAQETLARAIEAYRKRDVALADETRKLDKKMDEIFADIFYAFSAYVAGEPAQQKRAVQLLFIARFLERIGDHAVNIAEWVIYLETAERIHQKKHKAS